LDAAATPAGPLTRRVELVALLAILLVAGGAYGWDLDHQGFANAYYAAAVQAGTSSLKAMFFGSLEAGNVISTDKPPLALWLMTLSTRLFGFSAWSMLLPQVLQSVATVALLQRTVRRLAGPGASLVAATALATTPVFFVLARYNDVDTTLSLLMVGAAYATVRALESDSRRWLLAAGALVGGAFMTKWLVALIPVPALVLVIARGWPGPWRSRVARVGMAGAAAAVVGLWWVLVQVVLPASARPYEDSSAGSVLNLVLGQNGVSRVLSGPAVTSAVNGTPGIARLVEPPFSGQVGWLLPMALGAFAVPSLTRWAGPDSPTRRTAYELWGAWFAVTGVVFSLMTGAMHPYYTGLLAPAAAALVGLAVTDLWRIGADLGPAAAAVRALGGVLVVATGAYAVATTHSYPGMPHWTATVVTLGVVVALGLLLSFGRWGARRRQPAAVALGVAVAVATLTGPVTFGLATLGETVTGANPLAGPVPESHPAPYDPALVRFLVEHHRGQTWAAAVPTATPAARMELQLGLPVLPIGGFTGTAQAPSTSQLQQFAASGRLRYVVLAGPWINHPDLDPPELRRTPMQAVVTWARAHGCESAVPGSRVKVIDLTTTCTTTAPLPAH